MDVEPDAWHFLLRHSALYDILTAGEISLASTLIKKHRIGGERPGFGSLFVNEPDKAKVRAGEPVSRQARALVLDRTSAATWDVIVDLDAETILSSQQVTDGGAQMLAEEIDIVNDAAKADERFVEALAKRRIVDLTLVQLDPFGVGNRADLPSSSRCR